MSSKSRNQGLKHIKNKPEKFDSWTISNRKDVNIPDKIFKEFDTIIDGIITEKQSCILVGFSSYDKNMTGVDYEINLECYSIEWYENNGPLKPSFLRFMYIPKTEIDSIIRKIKIEKLKL